MGVPCLQGILGTMASCVVLEGIQSGERQFQRGTRVGERKWIARARDLDVPGVGPLSFEDNSRTGASRMLRTFVGGVIAPMNVDAPHRLPCFDRCFGAAGAPERPTTYRLLIGSKLLEPLVRH